jgi:hypothetical protein
MSLKRIAIPSPNYSSRGGTKVRLIVLHTAQGATNFHDLGGFFANPASGVSSHTGIDDTPGTIGEYVRRDYKAWTQANANPYAVAAELCAFAEWDTATWHTHPAMLETTAAWVAEEAAAFGIPIVALTAGQAQGGSAGVCQHVDLGAAGGNHWDCGPGFPMAEVIAMAGGSSSTPAPKPPTPPAGKAPPFPYPADHYLGQPSPDPECHSGFYGGVDTENVRTWQHQMGPVRGWAITVDGQYGPQSSGVCRQFQAEKGLAVDGLVGPATWSATWTAPIT